MRSLLALSALLVAMPTAHAQSVVGAFDVSGYGAGESGTNYTGTARVAATGRTYRYTGTNVLIAQGTGIYTPTGYYAVAFGGPSCSVAVYEAAREGERLTGTWTTTGNRRLGTEELVRTGERTYSVQGTNLRGARYTGTAEIVHTGETMQVSWTVGSTTFSGTGVSIWDNWAVAFGGPSCGVALYEYQNDAFNGVWARVGDREVGHETLAMRPRR